MFLSVAVKLHAGAEVWILSKHGSERNALTPRCPLINLLNQSLREPSANPWADLSHCKPLWNPQINEHQCPNHGALTLAKGAQVKPL